MDFVGVQETHLSEERCREVETQLGRAGWHALAAPGHGTQAGQPGHGGLLQMAPKRIAMGPFEGTGSPVIVEGRAAVTHIRALCSGGVAWVNVYLHTGVGMAQENIALLDVIAARVALIGKPYVITGDWNMEPGELASGTFLSQVRGTIVAPAEGTCDPAARVLDYFVVSAHLRRARASVWRGWPITPHVPVCLELEGDLVESWVQAASGPKAFPTPQASGCCRKDYSADWAAARAAVAGTESPDCAWRTFVACAECQLVDACGLTGDVEPYKGRADGVTLKWKRDCKPAPPRYPKATEEAVWCKQLGLGLRRAFADAGGTLQRVHGLRQLSRLALLAPARAAWGGRPPAAGERGRVAAIGGWQGCRRGGAEPGRRAAQARPPAWQEGGRCLD